MHIEFQLQNDEVIALRSDSLNFELARQRGRTNKDTGILETEWEGFSFHPSIENALNKILTLNLRSSQATTLEELKRDIELARHEINEEWKSSV
jgi:hypothetical protein